MESTSDGRSFEVALARLAGRIDLLVAHLAGPALRRRVGVEDLVQDVTVELLRSSRARELSSEELWRFVCAVARTTVIDAARRLRHEPRRMSSLAASRPGRPGGSSSAAGFPQRSSGGPGPGTLASTREQTRLLTTAFEALSAEHRRVLGLRRFEGLSARETAARMGRSEAAVHSLYRRALLAWSEAMAPDSDAP